MLFLLYPFHFCTVNVKAKDQSCKAFWLNNSGLFVGFVQQPPVHIVLRETRLLLIAQRSRHHGFDGVHPVFGLVKDDALGALEYLIGHLHGITAKALAHLLPTAVLWSW